MNLPQVSALRKAPPTSVTTCPCSARSRVEFWGESTGSFEAGCCGARVAFVKPPGASAPAPEGRPQVVRCPCSWTRVTITRGPVLGALRCGHCREAVDFVAMAVKSPRVALVDKEVAQ